MTDASEVTREDLVVVGRLSRPYGVQGEIRFFPAAENTDWILALKNVQIFLLQGNSPPAPVRVTLRRLKGGLHLALLEGIDSPEAAVAYAGADLAVHESVRPTLSDDEFYLDQLAGLRVLDPRGNDIGFVVRVVESRTSEFLEIQTATGTYLLGLEKALIAKIDLAKQRIELKDSGYSSHDSETLQ